MRSWKKNRQDWHQHRHQIHPHSIRSEQAGSDKLKPLEIRPWLSLFGASVSPVSKTGLILSLLGGYLGPGSFLWNAVGHPASLLPMCPLGTGEAEGNGEVLGREAGHQTPGWGPQPLTFLPCHHAANTILGESLSHLALKTSPVWIIITSLGRVLCYLMSFWWAFFPSNVKLVGLQLFIPLSACGIQH